MEEKENQVGEELPQVPDSPPAPEEQPQKEDALREQETSSVTQESTEARSEQQPSNDNGKKKKRVGRYKYHIDPGTYYNLLMELEGMMGRERKNRNVAMVFLVLALIPAIDAGLHPGNILAMIAAAVLILVGLMVKNQGRKAAKRSVRAVPNGFSLAVEVSSKGLKVQQTGQNGALLLYEGIRTVYDSGAYLSLVTGERTSMYIPKDAGDPNYLAIEQKLRQLMKDKYKVV